MLISKELVGEKHLNTFHNTTNSMAMGFLAPIFFAGIGLEFQFSSIQNYPLLFAIIAVSFLSKIIGGYVGGRFARLNHNVSLALGFGLNARGAMEIILGTLALDAGLINEKMFIALVIMAILTSVMSAPMMKKFID